MEIEDWGSAITEQQVAEFSVGLEEGVRSIDLSPTSENFIAAKLTAGQIGWNNEMTEARAECFLPYEFGGLDTADVAIMVWDDVIAVSVAITCADENGDLTNTYHNLQRAVRPADGAAFKPTTANDIGFLVGMGIAAMYYEIDSK